MEYSPTPKSKPSPLSDWILEESWVLTVTVDECACSIGCISDCSNWFDIRSRRARNPCNKDAYVDGNQLSEGSPKITTKAGNSVELILGIALMAVLGHCR